MHQTAGTAIVVNRFFDVVTIQKATSVLLLDGISIILQTVIGMAVLGDRLPEVSGQRSRALAMASRTMNPFSFISSESGLSKLATL